MMGHMTAIVRMVTKVMDFNVSTLMNVKLEKISVIRMRGVLILKVHMAAHATPGMLVTALAVMMLMNADQTLINVTVMQIVKILSVVIAVRVILAMMVMDFHVEM